MFILSTRMAVAITGSPKISFHRVNLQFKVSILAKYNTSGHGFALYDKIVPAFLSRLGRVPSSTPLWLTAGHA